MMRAVIMAAGKGTRMKSATPKVLHELCGRPMIEHVIDAVRGAGAGQIFAVVSPDLKSHLEGLGVACIVQDPQNGTGHAVAIAMAALERADGEILIASGDMPLVPAELLRAVVDVRARSSAELALVSARVPLPTNFGRIVREGGRIVRIVENADASDAERRIDEVNTGIYCFEESALRRHVAALRPDNAQGELYLTDCIASIAREGGRIEAFVCDDARLVMGINNRIELAAANAVLQRRILETHMLAGVTIVDPTSVGIDAGVEIGPDTTILPQTMLRGKTTVGGKCAIGPGCLLEHAQVADGVTIWYSVVRDSSVGRGVTIGPFAHLRGGSNVHEDARIGDYVELKNTVLGRGAKAQHLAYLGDAEIGEETNIGAGTITCNYDGKRKNKTKIGKRAFVGSNSSLVAPVSIGDEAMTGAGTVVIRDVPPGERVVGNPARPIKRKAEP